MSDAERAARAASRGARITARVVRPGVAPLRIDLITQASGITFDEAMEDHGMLMVEGIGVPVIGRDALLRNKRAAGRPQDLADVAALSDVAR